ERVRCGPVREGDIIGWHPRTYWEAFAASRLKHRDLVIAAYEAADPAICGTLDGIADNMNSILIAARDGLKLGLSSRTMANLAVEVAWRLKPMVARARSLINGDLAGISPQATAQAAGDAPFDAL